LTVGKPIRIIRGLWRSRIAELRLSKMSGTREPKTPKNVETESGESSDQPGCGKPVNLQIE